MINLTSQVSSCNVLHLCLAVIGWFLIVIITLLERFPQFSSVEQLSHIFLEFSGNHSP